MWILLNGSGNQLVRINFDYACLTTFRTARCTQTNFILSDHPYSQAPKTPVTLPSKHIGDGDSPRGLNRGTQIEMRACVPPLRHHHPSYLDRNTDLGLSRFRPTLLMCNSGIHFHVSCQAYSRMRVVKGTKNPGKLPWIFMYCSKQIFDNLSLETIKSVKIALVRDYIYGINGTTVAQLGMLQINGEIFCSTATKTRILKPNSASDSATSVSRQSTMYVCVCMREYLYPSCGYHRENTLHTFQIIWWLVLIITKSLTSIYPSIIKALNLRFSSKLLLPANDWDRTHSGCSKNPMESMPSSGCLWLYTPRVELDAELRNSFSMALDMCRWKSL